MIDPDEKKVDEVFHKLPRGKQAQTPDEVDYQTRVNRSEVIEWLLTQVG